jgi:Cu-Zn family superoxide dismutase
MKFPLLLILISLTACSSREEKKVEEANAAVPNATLMLATADIKSQTMKNLGGMITLEETPSDIKVTTNVSGLKPNSSFGFHVHQVGKCVGPDYKSAGDHFNPAKKPHGGPATEMRHFGDMGNLKSDAKGVAKEVITIPKEHGMSLSDLIGKSILIHAKADDFKTQPSGDSGNRVGCGLIKTL